MKKEKASTQSVKGFRDFVPEDWKVQRYIFETWRKVCVSYGYQEYNAPPLEYASIYAKSGQDVGITGKELYRFTDKGGRDLALRPEMTPSIGRMIAAYGQSYPKPIRWFSIAQFFRAEKPQRGRGREFFQLNADIFGSDSVLADFEMIKLSADLMLTFKATEKMFKVNINNRKFVNYYFEKVLEIKSEEARKNLLRIIDAYPKKDEEWLNASLEKLDLVKKTPLIKKYLNLEVSDMEEYIADSEGAKELKVLFELVEESGISKYCEFNPTMARGFDYYTGMVFEVFDINPENNRSMFGGGRYDDLLDIFGKPKMPAVGFAPGDYTMKLFLESWGLLDEAKDSVKVGSYYAPIIDESLYANLINIVSVLRAKGKAVELGLKKTSIGAALRDANKRDFDKLIIYGSNEAASGIYKIKDMKSGEEVEQQIKKLSK